MKLEPAMSRTHRRFCLPKTRQDLAAFSVFVFGGLFLLWYEIFHVFPTYYSNPSDDEQLEIIIHYFVASFLAVNIYGNMYKLVTTDTSKDRFLFMSGSFLPEGWRYCAECNLNLPPRSFHCKICDLCILKRDHHCWFAGYCIGYYNHRYYVAMVIHMVIAALYCNIFNLSFVVSIKGHLTLYTFLSYIGPHLGWIFGYYDLYVFAITLQTSIGTILLCLFVWMLYAQVCQIFYGQTKYERKKNSCAYNLGVWHNIREVFGKRWYFVLLFPWIPSPLDSPGLQFRPKNN